MFINPNTRSAVNRKLPLYNIFIIYILLLYYNRKLENLHYNYIQ